MDEFEVTKKLNYLSLFNEKVMVDPLSGVRERTEASGATSEREGASSAARV